jgi:hydantoinase/carbamoylase family amidase
MPFKILKTAAGIFKNESGRSIRMLNILLALLVLVSGSFVCSGEVLSADIIRMDDARISRHVEVISKIGNLGPRVEDGYTRAAWSNEESKAMEYIRQEGLKLGLNARYDAVGNLFLRTKNNSTQVIQVGSHLDTVPNGGTFDGAVGIITGLEAIRSVIEAGLPRDKDLELVIWRGEESGTYNFAYKGSKAAFGDKMPDDILNRTYAGVKLEDAVKKQGFDPSYIKLNKPTLTQADIDKIGAHFEVHIEQANKLEQDGDEIGIVTSIRGGNRLRVEVSGSFDHSGATPMGTKYRHDANLAIGYMQVEMDKLLNVYQNKGFDLVQTIGVINSDREYNAKNPVVYENTLTKVSGFGYFFLDIRSNSKKQRDDYTAEVKKTIQDVAGRFKTTVKIVDMGSSDPAEALDTDLQKGIEKSAAALGYRYQYMPSGAGHDSAIVAKQKKSTGKTVPVAMIFIPCKNGVSHAKEEFTKISDIKKGAEVLANTMYQLVK